jgi:hypothetical protein
MTLVLSLTVPGGAAAHGGPTGAEGVAGAGHHGGAGALAAKAATAVRLRECFLTAAFVPRPADALQSVFGDPLDLSVTFYGSDPLLGVWGLACERSRVAGRPAGRVVVSLVGVPTGLTSAGALPLANNFAHRLLRIDTSSRQLAAAARRAGLPARLSSAARYRHTAAGRVPSSGRLVVPDRYAIRVSASAADPTNPHDHANLFEHRAADGRAAALTLSIADAFDRFCLAPGEGCTASVRAPRGSALARLLGGSSAPARAGFDHDKLARVDLRLRGGGEEPS